MTLPANFVPTVTSPGLYPDLSATYHTMRHTPTKALTQSGIKTLLNETPFDFKNPTERKTKAMDMGSVVHALALGKGAKFAVSPFDEYRTNAAKEWRDETIANGLIPIKADDFIDAEKAASVIRAKVFHLLDGAAYQTEVPFFWQEGDTWCGGMIDIWCEEKLIAIDPKRTPYVHKRATAHMVNMGYDIQAAWTMRGLERIYPAYGGRIRFVNLLVKPDAPYTSRVVAINEAWRASAEAECDRALRIFAKCQATDTWPAYSDDIEMLDAPHWTIKERMETEMMESENVE